MEIKCIWINEELNHLRVCQAVTEMQRCSALQVPLTLSSSAAVRPSLLLFTPLIFTSFLPVSQCLIFSFLFLQSFLSFSYGSRPSELEVYI